MIPSIGVDAPLTLGAVDGTGILPVPSGTDDVLIYDLSVFANQAGIKDLAGRPGEGNTIVFGDLDFFGPCNGGTVPEPCAAVFYNLKNVSVGDPIQISLSGDTFDYQVTSLCHLEPGDSAGHVFEGGQPERLTLMTSAYLGTPTPPNIPYYQTVIMATRVGGPNIGCPEGTKEGAVPSG